MAPEVSAYDLSKLGAYQAAARLVVGGEDQPAFTLRTRPAPPAVDGRATLIRERARSHAAQHRSTGERGSVKERLAETAPGRRV